MNRSSDGQFRASEDDGNRAAVVLEGREDQPVDVRPRIVSEGRPSDPIGDAPPDPRSVIDDLRNQLRVEREKSLNATDAVLGARAAAAQAKAETQDVFYRLHVRETELAQLKELLAAKGETGETGRGVGGSAGEPAPPTVAARALLASVKRAVQER